MTHLKDMIWVEFKKAVRSKMPIWTALGGLFMPMGMAALILLAKNPEVSRNLGLISAKADLIKYAATDWTSYLVLFSEIVGMGGFFFFVMAVAWVFGREFTDGTLKDLLAVPVDRASILLAKFVVAAIWSAAIAAITLVFGLVMGAALRLPGGSFDVLLNGSRTAAITACLTIAVVLPFGFFASVGRGYLLPLGAAVIALIMSNLVVIIGWGECFPWAIPIFYAQGETALPPVSFGIVILTGLAGMIATYYWWKVADQNR